MVDFPDLTDEQYKELEKKMVWVFGSMRSGTTWLALKLLEHEDNISWNEPFIGNNLNQMRHFAKDSQKGRSDYFFSDHHKNQLHKGIRRLILDRTYSQSGNIEKNIIIKEPSGSIGSDIIANCLPDSKMIFLLRDGRDIVDSMIDAHKPNSWWKELAPIKNQEERIEKIKEYSEMWKTVTKMVQKAYDNHNSNLRLLVKYEDLIKNTLSELRKIYSFVGIDISGEELQKKIKKHSFSKIPESEKGSGKFARAASPGGWRKNFSEKEQKVMNKMLKDSLKKYDYEIL